MLDVHDFRKMTAHWRHKCHIQRLDAMLEETEPVRELGLLKRELLFLLPLLEIAKSWVLEFLWRLRLKHGKHVTLHHYSVLDLAQYTAFPVCHLTFLKAASNQMPELKVAYLGKLLSIYTHTVCC